jgi:hypothetical protein
MRHNLQRARLLEQVSRSGYDLEPGHCGHASHRDSIQIQDSEIASADD